MRSVLGTEPIAIIDALATMLQSMASIVKTVRPEAVQLLRLLAPLPAEERTAIVEALEREVDARIESLAAGDGAVGRLDHTSQLFVRVFSAARAPTTPSADDILESCLHGLLHLSEFPPRLEGLVLDGVGRALAVMPARERAVLADMFRALGDALETPRLEQTA